MTSQFNLLRGHNMAAAFKCDKCGEYFDDKKYTFEDIDTFMKDVERRQVTIKLTATEVLDSAKEKEYEFCGNCWLPFLHEVHEELENENNH